MGIGVTVNKKSGVCWGAILSVIIVSFVAIAMIGMELSQVFLSDLLVRLEKQLYVFIS